MALFLLRVLDILHGNDIDCFLPRLAMLVDNGDHFLLAYGGAALRIL